MNIPMNPTATWQNVAIFEVDDSDSTLYALSTMDGPGDIYRIAPSRESPSGRRWFDVDVDFSVGERRAIRITQALIAALEESDKAGIVGSFRVVCGNEWLQLAALQLSASADFSGPALA